MSITFQPAGISQQGYECICVALYTKTGELMEGHDSCPGFICEGEKIPELNIANGNASCLFKLLNMSPDGKTVNILGIEMDVFEGGVIPAADLLIAVSHARTEPANEFALRDDQSERYLAALTEICNFAMEKGVEVQFA